jgi:hypothetical protein
MVLQGNCETDSTILVPDGFTLDGGGFTITAVDPVGGHFTGAVIRNAGAVAHVTNVTVTASMLADVCDGGADRLVGILFDGAGGSIREVSVIGLRQGATSGCQEGNAIVVRNFEPDGTTPAATQHAVTIEDSTVTAYQKNGITAAGNVAATVLGNIVVGDGPADYIAQNGIQVSYGATAILRENAVTGNWYSPKAWLACGVLFYDAGGVRQQANHVFKNEKNVCNFGGRGGGNFNPAGQ